jgi:aryl-alcohol dehydrogenase-like predicted oxidoreductase
MEYRQLGDSGMRVSTLGLGCFAFAGDKSSGSHLGQASARARVLLRL